MSRFQNQLANTPATPEWEVRRITPTSPPLEGIWRFFQSRPVASIALLLAILSALIPVLGDAPYLLKSSLVSMPQIRWEGTHMPLVEVAYWPAVSEGERHKTFSQLGSNQKAPLPPYDLQLMQAGREWTATNERARQAYVTWSVPHAGNYQLDATEWSGSHPGVDIRVPEGTPIYSAAAGIVTRVQHLSSGFGVNIIVTHPNVPDPDNPAKETTLRTLYGHLSQTFVKEGQVVRAGEELGLTGNTGLSTAPHLHFQMERASAPFAGYWPFNWQDVEQAGYKSFFDAVKYGLGQDNIRIHMVHPIEYIEKYQMGATPLTREEAKEERTIFNRPENNTRSTSENRNTYTPLAPQPTTERVTIQPRETSPTPDTSIPTQPLEVAFRAVPPYTPGQDTLYHIEVNDVASLGEGIKVESSLGSLAHISPKNLTADHFKDNTAVVRVRTQSRSGMKLTLRGSFGRETSPFIPPNIVIKSQTTTKTQNTRPVTYTSDAAKVASSGSFTDLSDAPAFSSALVYWAQRGVIRGYDDGTIRPNQQLNRAEAVKILLQSEGLPTSTNNTFRDVPNDTWFAPWVSGGLKHGIIKGYEDGTFRPGNNVTRAEFLIMALRAADITPPPAQGNIGPDVPFNAWYADAVAWGRRQGLFPSGWRTLFRPGESITRGEAFFILYKLATL